MKKQVVTYCLLAILTLPTFANSDAAENNNYKYDAIYCNEGPAFTLATGSPGSLGLLKALADPFCDQKKCRINWLKMGSGAALKTLKENRVHMVLVHAPVAEKKAVAEGWACMRTLIGANEFFVVGPESDPAGIANETSVIKVYAKIAEAKARFFSRGDNSGTHQKEMMIWEKAGIKPQGPWYVTTGDFMGPTLIRADKEEGYFMTDSSTYVSKKPMIKNLKVLFSGDPLLINVYHALVAPEDRISSVMYILVSGFVDFIKSKEGQTIIREFGKKEYGSALYMDADNALKYGN